MKGVVFNLLNEMVEERFGFEAWESLLEATGSDGVFVATESYPDEELLALVGAASEATGIAVPDLVRAFGTYMVPRFREHYPKFFEDHTHLRSFLLTVDQVILVEVRKLMPDAGLPEFADEDDDDEDDLTMIYRSPRKLCALAEGLIDGSATAFGTEYELVHDVCMHKGADHCRLEMRFH